MKQENVTIEEYRAGDIPNIMPERDKKEVKQQEKEKKEMTEEQIKALQSTFDHLIAFAINGTYLRDIDKKNHLKAPDIEKTEISVQLLNTLNYYFPDGKYDHPLIGLSVSVLTLAVVINSKKPIRRPRNAARRNNEPSKGNDTREPPLKTTSAS